MTESIDFVKMHGCGNDFVVVETSKSHIDDLATVARMLCNRHFGIGADGLLVIEPSAVADARMRIFNSDGSEAQMCGNGIRCIGKYLYENRSIKRDTLSIETNSGIKQLKLDIDSQNRVCKVTVDMGKAIVENIHLTLNINDTPYDICSISTGNPHRVLFCSDIENIEIASLGSQLENHHVWTNKANIEFACVVGPHRINQRTWERGVGETLACGTGAIAAALAAVERGYCKWPVTVSLLGGELTIDFDPKNEHITLSGPAATVFFGKLSYNI